MKTSILLSVILMSGFAHAWDIPKLPPEVIAERALQRDMERDVTHYLREKLRNPDSLKDMKFGKVIQSKKNTNEFYLAARYRAQNGFGGYVVSETMFVIDTNKLTIISVDIGK